jgi:hypothetical protein
VGSSSRAVEASLAAFRSAELERLGFVHFLGVFAFGHWRIPEAGSFLLSFGPFDRGSVLFASIHATFLSGLSPNPCVDARLTVYRQLANTGLAVCTNASELTACR